MARAVSLNRAKKKYGLLDTCKQRQLPLHLMPHSSNKTKATNTLNTVHYGADF